jgi:NADH-quinone oxidoreductase subunit N
MTVFMFSLAGIPPFGGWFAKFYIFRAVFDSGTPWSVVLGVVVAVNSVIGLFYYASVPRQMWMNPVPDDNRTAVRVPAPLSAALGICLVVVLAIGVYPQIFAHMGDVARLGQ